MVDLGALAQCLAEGRGADRRDHELLDVDVGVGVRPTVEDVHHRHREHVGVGAADVAVERQAGGVGRGASDGQRDAEDRVGAEVRLVGRAVEVDHRLVDEALVVGLHAFERRADLGQDTVDGAEDALAEVAVAAVAQLDRLERSGGGATGHGGPGEDSVVELDLDLDSGVAARVEDLACSDGFDCCHDAHSWVGPIEDCRSTLDPSGVPQPRSFAPST